MPDRTNDETANGRVLTFFIETQLTNAHHGVVRVRELHNGNKRFLKRSHLFLYRLDQEQGTVGEALARRIYEDQIENRQGRYKGPRWDFQQPCLVQLFQIIEQPDSSLSRGTSLKREIGAIHLSGGLDTSLIISQIAQAIDTGWQAPPDEAYQAPDEIECGLASGSNGSILPMIVEFELNHRKRKGSIVFIATEEDGESLDQCALLLLDEESGKPSFNWYYLLSFEDTQPDLFLCDQGVHPLAEPILLFKDEDDWPCYWVQKGVTLLVEGGKQFAPSGVRRALEHMKALLAEAIPNYSLYCSGCHKEYRPAPSESALQEASKMGYVTTLCAHTWWCPACQRWSTPTERTPLIAANDVCTHPRPAGWESHLTNNAQEMSAPTPVQADLAHELPPLHPYSVSFSPHRWLPGQVFPPRHPGRYLPESTGADRRSEQSGEPDTVQLVTFLEDCYFDTTKGESDFVPQGTRLVGILNANQLEDKSIVAIIVNTTTWNISRSQITLVPLNEALTQETIAEKSKAEAERRDQEQDYAGAQMCYARAIVEYEAAGWPELRLAVLRMNRAGLLLTLKEDAEGASELNRAAHIYEAQAHDQKNRMVSAHLDYAEQAVDALIPLALVYLYRAPDEASARNVIERLLLLNALIKKRYERKVDLLLYLTEFFLKLDEPQEALTYFEQANRFYSQQLANMADFPHVAPITNHLKKVREKLNTVKQTRTVRFTITAKTPDDLDAVLRELQKCLLTGVEVTKPATAQRTTKYARSGLVYVANLRIIIRSDTDSRS